MTARGIPTATYPVCGVCCPGEGDTLSWSWPGEWGYPCPGTWLGTPSPLGKELGPETGVPPARKDLGPETMGYTPSLERTWDQGRDLGPEAMRYPPPPQLDKLKTLPSCRTTYAGVNYSQCSWTCFYQNIDLLLVHRLYGDERRPAPRAVMLKGT